MPRLAGLALLLYVGAGGAGCSRRSSSPTQAKPAHSASAGIEVLLRGHFTGTARPASGQVLLRRNHAEYELVLSNVQLSATDPVHVYLVGLDEAPSTAAVARVDAKYDFGPLHLGSEPQVIRLPSKPAPGLRSVVLWHPRFGINLAFAALHSP